MKVLFLIIFLTTITFCLTVKAKPSIHRLSKITTWDKAKSYSGLNLVCHGWETKADLLDMSGRVIYTWSYPSVGRWSSVYYDNGNLYTIEDEKRLIKLDSNSNKVWEIQGFFHHDITVDKDLYVLGSEQRGRVLDNLIYKISKDGKILKSISLLDTITPPDYLYLDPYINDVSGDVLHACSLEVKDGKALVSLRNIKTLVLIDLDKEKVLWSKVLGEHHNAQILKNGNILAFDNSNSRVTVYNPKTDSIVWEYGDLNSDYLGVVQKLPNGNVLITDSMNGRILEVTEDKEKVWEYKTDKTIVDVKRL